MENKTVYCIIVNWNGKKDTDICLSSLKKINTKGVHFHGVVVDNGSSDDSVEYFRKKYPHVTIIPAGKNLGFTGGNNTGIDYALAHGANYIWLLNNDTFVDKNVLSILSVFDDPKVGLAGSKIYFAPEHEFHHDRYKQSERGKVLWYAGGLVDWKNMYASHRGVDEVDHGQYDTVKKTDFISGCSMMIRREALNTVGKLDDKFYLYLEDLDLCIRAEKAGFSLMYVPSSVLWHVNAGSSARPGNPLQQYYITRNRLLVGLRYAPIRTKLALVRESCRFLLSGTGIQRKAILDAVFFRFGNRFSLKQ